MAEVDSDTQSSVASRQRQLSLAVHLRDDATLDNYLALPRVEPLLRALRQQLAPDGEPAIYLYGPPGSGKSHLLQASCHAAGANAVYLPLAELRQFPACEVLQGVENLQRVCLDDIHAILGDPAWEVALFDFYNRARQHGCRLVVAGDAAPRVLPVSLADLRSRLSWGIVYQLEAGNDADKVAILQFRAMRRGLALPAGVASYIVSRAPRALEQLLGVLDQLDQASLAEQRALSIPFVKQALGW